MGDYNLVGRIRPVYRGAWDSGAAYTALEVVVSSDSHTAYIAKKDVPAGAALTDTAYWGVIADVRDLATAVGEALIDLDNMALKPPVIGENGNWQLWDFDLNAYVDSGLPSRGERGESDSGSGAGVVFATLTLSGSTYSCDMTYDEIQAEIEAGKLVRLKWQTNDATIRNYDYVGTFGLTTSPYVVFQYQSQTGYGTVFVYQNGTVNHYNGTLVRNSLTVNGHALTENVVLTAADVGALPNSDETWAEIDSRVKIATPVRGTDYWTEEDQETIVQQVIAVLGTPVFGTVDADNNIILTGELADGTYTLKYEDSDGNLTEIGTIDIGGGITNLIPLSINSDGSEYVGDNGEDGYRKEYRISTSSGNESSAAGYACTGFMPVAAGDMIYGSAGILEGDTGWVNLSFYDSSFARINGYNLQTLPNMSNFTQGDDNSFTFSVTESGNITADMLSRIAYFRVGSQGIYSGDAIITTNEPIA